MHSSMYLSVSNIIFLHLTDSRGKGKLWEFIRDLLLDSATCPTIIKWENRSEGIFRIVKSDQVAQLWGKRKCNKSMTYEKMSRAMRWVL